jgi:CheY-like chemotaxis protein
LQTRPGNLTIRVSESAAGKRRLGKNQETISLHKGEEVVVNKRGSVVIEVVDEGVGMTPSQVKLVFEDGTQFNANENQGGGGSGLGLNIAKGIVDQHGGTLSCHSDGMGFGTTFVLSLPLYDYDDADEEVRADAPAKAHSEGSEEGGPRTPSLQGDLVKEDVEFVIPKLHILVVDDALTNRKLCMRLLERNGHTCSGACDGVEAVEMVRLANQSRTPYDCILLDYEMPNMKGPEACEEMRKMGCSSYIVGVTGNVMTEDVDHFRNSGADWVLAKPFRLEALEQLWVENDVTPFNNIDGEESTGVVRVSSSTQLVGMDDDLARSLKEHIGVT